MTKQKKDPLIQCQFCKKQITKSNISKHIKQKHPSNYSKELKSYKSCKFKWCQIKHRSWKKHFKEYHLPRIQQFRLKDIWQDLGYEFLTVFNQCSVEQIEFPQNWLKIGQQAFLKNFSFSDDKIKSYFDWIELKQNQTFHNQSTIDFELFQKMNTLLSDKSDQFYKKEIIRLYQQGLEFNKSQLKLQHDFHLINNQKNDKTTKCGKISKQKILLRTDNKNVGMNDVQKDVFQIKL